MPGTVAQGVQVCRSTRVPWATVHRSCSELLQNVVYWLKRALLQIQVKGSEGEVLSFGLCLRELRKSAGVTQADLAASIGVSNTYISALESGRKPAPPHALVSAIAARLGVPDAALWQSAQAEREDHLRRRIQGVPTSLRRRRHTEEKTRAVEDDAIEASVRALTRTAQSPETRKQLAEALEQLARALRQEDPLS